MWIYALFIWLLYTPLCWVREIKFLSNAFIFAVFCQVVGVLTTAYYAGKEAAEEPGPPPGFEPIVSGTFWNMIGFAFFMFEGIGCLLPIMKETANTERYPKIVLLALCTLCAVYVVFAFICYYGWGDTLD